MSLAVGNYPLMVVILLAVPLGWFVLLWMLDWLEERTLISDERARTINDLLQSSGPETIELEVSRILNGSVRRRSDKASASP